ncbi:GNAT family N-acetyltransferase [Pontibacter sp. MBLB2868]|uniref:GNAT family N-acetyltransferase n=1 Tax=Pontibacter sp. MBLB2868 TaxID=3451555 RepID=UPI003F755D1D
MQIRKGTEEDIPAIVDLLKTSLGEGLIEKSEHLWKWKHVQNPHGASPVLVAEDEGKLVGVRAFLQWQWQYNGKMIKAVRAVDTATHPDFQGKGIFKRLTLQGLEDAKAAGTSIVYNTPNQSSMPGYLKMGWVEQGRMPLKLKLNPFAYKSTVKHTIPDQDWTKLLSFLPLVVNPISKSKSLHTVLTPAYISWRYQNNPLFDYYYLSDYKSYVLFYRLKAHSFGTELRVVDLFVNESAFNKLSRKQLRQSFKEASRSSFLVSASGRHFNLASNFYPGMGFIPVVDKGPIVTLRNLLLPEDDFEALVKQQNWGYSLGDMELF